MFEYTQSIQMASISPEKVNPAVKDKLLAYQEECAGALRDYWTKGRAINPAAMWPCRTSYRSHQGRSRAADSPLVFLAIRIVLMMHREYFIAGGH
jgi:hypothetical protein